MLNKWKKLSRKAKKRVLLLILFALVFVVLPGTFALYKSLLNVQVTTVAGEMISDIEIDSNENYIENNVPYFFVTVKNYRTIGNNTILSNTGFDYTLYVDNKDGSNGKFYYLSDDGTYNNTPVSSLVIENGHLESDVDSTRYKVFVTRDGNLRTTVDYKVRLEANQSNSNN